MKRLVIEVLTTEWGKFWRVKEQTHRQNEFGPDGCAQFEYDGFNLLSLCHPAAAQRRAYLRGDNKTQDADVCSVPDEKWLASLRAAVKAYNKHFADDAPQATGNIETIE